MAYDGMVVRDTTGAIRIPHEAMPSLTPCNCRCRIGEQACRKNYCPCRKAGFYCGASCKCRHHSCCNRSPQDQLSPQEGQEEETQNQQPDPKRQKTSDHSMMPPERALTEAELIKCEEILAHASEIDLDGLIDPALWVN